MGAIAQVLLGLTQAGPVFNFTDVKALYHFEGANNATTTADSSLSSRAITLTGNAKIRTAASGGAGGIAKWGASSLYLDGTSNSFATIADTPALDFSTDDFTLEGWFASGVTATSNKGMISLANGGNIYYMYSQDSSGDLIRLYNSGSGILITGPAFVFDNAFRHMCMMRKNGVLYMFVDGVVYGSTPLAAAFNPTSIVVGAYPGNTELFVGNVDDFRVSQFAVYPVTGFTPPAAQFPDS